MNEELEILAIEPCNDALKDDFDSKLDPYFTAEAPSSIREYKNWERQPSRKLWGSQY